MSTTTCALCGEPMPPGEEMFNYHGSSGPCPKPPRPVRPEPLSARWQELFWALPSGPMRSKLRALESDIGQMLRAGQETAPLPESPKLIRMAWLNLERALLHVEDEQICGIWPDGSSVRGEHLKNLIYELKQTIREAAPPAALEHAGSDTPTTTE